MKIRFLIALCCVLVSCKEVHADGEYDVKRGTHPFMAFVYYLDDYVVDEPSHTRFLRAAVLIRPDWLISGAIDHPEKDGIVIGFPRKTLLARTGAILIDSNFTLNEDEDEQEREIIQIVRPYDHKPEKWWLTDITLLKTLLPFNNSTAVTFINPSPRKDLKPCFILFYSRLYSNITLERHLMQKFIEISNNENCGSYYNNESMICATDMDGNKGPYDPDTFCQGNGGGPLVCDGEVIGTQTYINDDCKPPYLYQLFFHWETLISCSLEENCDKEYFCANVCKITSKDPPTVTYSPTRASSSMGPETEASEEASSSDTGTSSEDEASSSSSEAETSSTASSSTAITQSDNIMIMTTTTSDIPASVSSWPKEAPADGRKKVYADDVASERTPKAEAQLQQDVSTNKPKRSSADRNMCFIHSLLLGYFVLTCVI